MIEYVEIRSKSNRQLVGIIDNAKSLIWHRVFFGVGDFEIYAPATGQNLLLLQVDNYVTRPNDFDGTFYKDIGIIESVEITRSAEDGTMIVASGRFGKSILDRRQICKLSGHTNKPTILKGNVETAVRSVVHYNAMSCTHDIARNISFIVLADYSQLPAVIVDENGNPSQKQVSYENLLEYTDKVLQEYNYSAKMLLDDSTIVRVFRYLVYGGTDRSVDNTDGNNPVIFSTDYDNLSESTYLLDCQKKKTAVLIGGAGEDVDRFYSMIRGTATGADRREMWVDAHSINKELKASSLQETFPTGVFDGLTFKVGGVVYANLVINNESKYTLSSLQSKFPSGTVSGAKFVVGGVTYATQVYGEENSYTLTPIGYKAMLDADEKEGQYILTDSVYDSQLVTKGKQELAAKTEEESFDGTLNITGGIWRLDEDYTLGDIVTVQDNEIGKYINVRIAEITESQDENGYNAEVKYIK